MRCYLGLPLELAAMDQLLNHQRLFDRVGGQPSSRSADPQQAAPPFFDDAIGRPSIPMKTYLRTVFLKYRYRLGYESLCP